MESSEGDRYLIDQIKKGDADAWRQLVERYQGRLLAFARAQLRRAADAEDLVQDAFVNFLQQRHKFDPARSLETFLFMLLRRRIIDHVRGRAARMCFVRGGGEEDESSAGAGAFDASPHPSASWYARRDEQADALRRLLGESLRALVERFKRSERFRELQVAEMLFYAQLRNGEIARLLDMDEKAVALLKHRWLKELAEGVEERSAGRSPPPLEDATSLLTEVWEQNRPTCPKRSTLGRWHIGSLEEPWASYVGFHVQTLHCRFCQANLDDLRQETAAARPAQPDHIFQSTIGFLRKA